MSTRNSAARSVLLTVLLLPGLAYAQAGAPPTEAPPKPAPKPHYEGFAESVPGVVTMPPVDDLEAELRAAAAADASEGAESRPAPAPAAPAPRAAYTPAAASPSVGGVGFYDNSSNPAISFIMDGVAIWYSTDKAEHRNHGGHVPADTGPHLQGVELAVSTNIDPFFQFQMEFNLEHLHFEQAYATTTALPYNLQVRAGQYRTRLGRQNVNCLHQWRFIDPPLALTYLFGPEGITLPGAELSVLLPLPWYAELMTSVQGGLTRSQDADTIDGFGDLIYSPRLVQFFDLSDDVALQLGLNASLARSPLPDPDAQGTANRSWIWGADLYLKWRPIGQGRTGFFYMAWTTEAWLRELEVPDDLWRDLGGYSELQVGLSKDWSVAARVDLWRRLEGAEPDAVNRRLDIGADTLRGQVALSFAPSHFSRLRLQYGLEDIEGFELGHIVALQLEVSAGAHGAHSY